MITRRIARPLGALSPSAWVCPACTTRSAASPITAALPKPSSVLPRQQRRTLLSVPRLSHDPTFQKDGVPNLFSPKGYKLVWSEYQEILVRKLNELLQGEVHADKPVKDLALEFARDPLNASVFNHASMLHNNHFFFESMSPSPRRLDDEPEMKTALEKTFGSIDNLRLTMIDTALSMFGPGFVWLVWVRPPSGTAGATFGNTGTYRVLTTYNAGTPYPEAGYQQRGVDMANTDAQAFEEYKASQIQPPLGKMGRFSTSGKEGAKYPPGGTHVSPVLCVNTWEHAYIYDYGLGGKKRYVEDWWMAVDWHKVWERVPAQGKDQGPSRSLYFNRQDSVRRPGVGGGMY